MAYSPVGLPFILISFCANKCKKAWGKPWDIFSPLVVYRGCTQTFLRFQLSFQPGVPIWWNEHFFCKFCKSLNDVIAYGVVAVLRQERRLR